ncbi:uncharacterized protein TM35_000311560 [Trypanosoma theileri]|uniref:Uncharacterized protein n=1 Tax=Trypanosoma theileri TaxID=67003 RepID=A0A1X0NPA9_9TRYP|nr:uncharacterized protein TM35_000311560 [Trypanosoma theileri]ORC85970.1 hypothetical protein TM35_000311560 [Trypanosoma theileri]
MSKMSILKCFTALLSLTTVPESELQAKYDAAVKRWEAAKQATEAADGERDGKSMLAAQKRRGTKESYLACAEYWKAEIGFLEKCEQECAAEYEKHASYANLMIHQYGVDSKVAQIARYRAELTYMKEFTWDWTSPYWTKWHQLLSKASMLYNQLRAEGCDAEADELDRAEDEFCDRISSETNSEAFREAWNAAVAALDKWEETTNRAAWDVAKLKYYAELKKWNVFKPIGEQYAALLMKEIQRISTVVESQLQVKYDAALKRWEAAKEATEAAKRDRDEKSKLAAQILKGTREYHHACAEYWKAEFNSFVKCEEECTAEYEKHARYASLILHKYGSDCTAAQIARYRAELTQAKDFTWDWTSPYCTKWHQLLSKASMLYNQLRAEGCDAEADEVDDATEDFCNRISNESNCKTFRKALDAAVAALNRWEQTGDRAAWDKAKLKYYAELEKWNVFHPKGDLYAGEFENEMQRLTAIAESQLKVKYEVAFQHWESAKEATEAAKRERDEKCKLAARKPKGTIEAHLASAEYWKAENTFFERCEQECVAEYEKHARHASWMIHQHGADSKVAQIARYRAELTCTKEIAWDWSSPYCTKWHQLLSNALQLYNQFKSEGCDAEADELDDATDDFCDRISNESNGRAFREAWNAAVAALDKWEETDDRADWDKAKSKYDADLETWSDFKPNGDEYAAVLEKQMQRLTTLAEAQVEVKYDAAVKRWEAAKEATEAAKRERDEKRKLAKQKPKGTREYHRAWAESWESEIAFFERCEQECAAECKKCETVAFLMIDQHGADSDAAQIARYRAELIQAKEYTWDDLSPYWIKWNTLMCKSSMLYWQLKALGCDAVAREFERAEREFREHMKTSNGDCLYLTWRAAVAALDRWEETGDRTAWDKAKPKYDTEWEKWNVFKPKGEPYAAVLENKMKKITTATKSELQVKYDAAVKRWEAAKQATEAAKVGRDEKRRLAKLKPKDTREYHLALVESWKAEFAFFGRCEQEHAAECEKWETATHFLSYQDGADSDAAQIARYRAELTRAKEFTWDDRSPYWIKWNKLMSKSSLLYWQLKAEGCDAVAREFERAEHEFREHIKTSNGDCLYLTWRAAVAALNRWEETGNRTVWDKAKHRYDAEWEQWNEFKPRGEQYAAVLENRVQRLTTLTEAELQAKYDAAVKRWEATQKIKEAAKVERDEKRKLAKQKPKDTRESHFSWAESWKAEITFVEMCEQECAAECEKLETVANLMYHQHGADSDVAEIARYRAELTRTKEFTWEDRSPYWIKWNTLMCKSSMLYWQLKEAGCDAVASKLEEAEHEFHEHIKTSNGDCLYLTWRAAVAALDRWEETGNRTAWDKAKSKYDVEFKNWNAFKPKGKEYAAVLENEVQRSNAFAVSELQVKYDAAVKRWEAAKKVTEAAKVGRDGKRKLAKQKSDDTREYHLAWAESWKAEITFVERCEQECAAECKKWENAATLIIQQHGADCTAAQIARYRAELTRAKEFTWDGRSPYWIKWNTLMCKSSMLYWQLKAESCDAVARELAEAEHEFREHIKTSNGDCLYLTWSAAVAALDGWEETGDRTAWDKAKTKYDVEFKNWNAFEAKGEQYEKEFKATISECAENISAMFSFLDSNSRIQEREDKFELNGMAIRELEDDIGQNGLEILDLKNDVEQKGKKILDLTNNVEQKGKKIRELKGEVERKGQVICQLQGQLEKKSKEICELKGEVKQKNKKIRGLKGEVEKRSQKIHGLEVEVGKGGREIRELKNEVDEKGRKIKELETKCKKGALGSDRLHRSAKESSRVSSSISRSQKPTLTPRSSGSDRSGSTKWVSGTRSSSRRESPESASGKGSRSPRAAIPDTATTLSTTSRVGSGSRPLTRAGAKLSVKRSTRLNLSVAHMPRVLRVK